MLRITILYIKLLFSKQSKFKYCFKCPLWSGYSLRSLVFKKRLKFLRPKFWLFLIVKNNIFAKGLCNITFIDKKDEHVTIECKGYNKCIFRECGLLDQIVNAQDFINKIPNSPELLQKKIEEIENESKKKNRFN